MHIELDYQLDLSQRLEWAHNIDWDSKQYKEKQLELIADYILYADKPTPKKESKYVKSKCTPRGLRPIAQENAASTPTVEYTNPRPVMHTEDPVIQSYTRSLENLKQIEQKTKEKDKWKVRRWIIEHRLDMGLANQLLHAPIKAANTYVALEPPFLDELVDLTNSFHVAKFIDLYSQLRQSEESRMWVKWVEEAIIDKTPLYDWQFHLLIRRIDGANQITVGRELGELYGKIVTPSTMSQALRTIYRQISITAEKELFAFFNRDNPLEWQTCQRCGESKMKKYDFYPSKPHVCKVCLTGRRTIKGNMKYKNTKEEQEAQSIRPIK